MRSKDVQCNSMKSHLKLHNVSSHSENDTYAECAGVVERKCIEVAVDGWEHHSNILNVVLAYINCYDEETKTCDAPIARQINIVIQAFKKHLQENHGLLGAMIDKIDH